MRKPPGPLKILRFDGKSLAGPVLSAGSWVKVGVVIGGCLL